MPAPRFDLDATFPVWQLPPILMTDDAPDEVFDLAFGGRVLRVRLRLGLGIWEVSGLIEEDGITEVLVRDIQLPMRLRRAREQQHEKEPNRG